MATVTHISEQEFLDLALNEEDGFWELWDGVLVEKPQMSMRHNAVSVYLVVALANQVDPRAYRVSHNGDRTRISARSYYIPDVMVIPAAYQLPPYQEDPWGLGAYREPLPLVVEVWSPTTGRYDLTVKLHGYRERGDLEIWYLHPRERTLRVWRKHPDGSYTEELFRGGVIPVASLPGVAVDLNALLAG